MAVIASIPSPTELAHSTASAILRAPVLPADDVAASIGALSDALERHSDNAAVVRAASEGLLAAAYCSPDDADQVLTYSGASKALLTVLRNHGASPEVSIAACSALAVAAASSVGATAIVDAGGILCIVDVLRETIAAGRVDCDSNGATVEMGEATSQACRLLAELSVHEVAMQQLANSAAIELLAAVISAAAAACAVQCRQRMTAVSSAIFSTKAVATITLIDGALGRFIAAGGIAPLVWLLKYGLQHGFHAGDPSIDQRPGLNGGGAASTVSTPASSTPNSSASAKVPIASLPMAAAVANEHKEAAVMAINVAEVMLSLSAVAQGASALVDAGAVSALLTAISVRSSAAGIAVSFGGNNVSLHRASLWEAACWTLLCFSRDNRHLCALEEAGSVAKLLALLAVCDSLVDAPDADLLVAADAASETAIRTAGHARALLIALGVVEKVA